MHCNPTRRTFLKGTAATAALAAVGTCSVAAWRAEQAEAAATGAAKIQGASLCNGCSSKCGLIATALDGRLWMRRGHEGTPLFQGNALRSRSRRGSVGPIPTAD
ncbi:MAG: twin-arginine translocation signal domain-containing protein [Adlercreutzia equolifaciens]